MIDEVRYLSWLTIAVNSDSKPAQPKLFPRPGVVETPPEPAVSLATFASLMEE